VRSSDKLHKSRQAHHAKTPGKTTVMTISNMNIGSLIGRGHSATARQTCSAESRPNNMPVVTRYAFIGFIQLERDHLDASTAAKAKVDKKARRRKGAKMILPSQIQATKRGSFVSAPIPLPAFASLRLCVFALNPFCMVTVRIVS
jgi:hypothetical protein